MSRVRSKNTAPEMRVRRLVHGMGYRYRLHARDLPGTPDLVFRSRRKVILIHGCFWHMHEGCADVRLPRSRRRFWIRKLSGNRARDLRDQLLLHNSGWDVLVLWACQLHDEQELRSRIRAFLDGEP